MTCPLTSSVATMLRRETSAMMRSTLRMSASLNSSEMRRPVYCFRAGIGGGGGGALPRSAMSPSGPAGGADSVERMRFESRDATGCTGGGGGGGGAVRATGCGFTGTSMLCDGALISRGAVRTGCAGTSMLCAGALATRLGAALATVVAGAAPPVSEASTPAPCATAPADAAGAVNSSTGAAPMGCPPSASTTALPSARAWQGSTTPGATSSTRRSLFS